MPSSSSGSACLRILLSELLPHPLAPPPWTAPAEPLQSPAHEISPFSPPPPTASWRPT
jgi:hypothetical protein